MEQETILKKVAEIMKRHLDEEYRVYLFGSWAKGDSLPTSDIDIGILGVGRVPWETMAAIKGEIEAIPTLRSIDVVDLQAAGASFRENVLADAKPIV